MTFKLYQLYLNAGVLTKVGGTEETLNVIDVPTFEETLDLENGSFKVSNIQITCTDLDRTYFSDLGKTSIDDRPFVLEILDNGGSLFWHGIVEPTSVSYNRNTRRTAFIAVGWEYYLSIAGKVPPRSVYVEPNARLYPLPDGTTTVIKVPTTTPVAQGDVIVVEDSTGREFRAIVFNASAIQDGVQTFVVSFAREELVASSTFDLDSTPATAHFQFVSPSRMIINTLGDAWDSDVKEVVNDILSAVQTSPNGNQTDQFRDVTGGDIYGESALTMRVFNSSDEVIANLPLQSISTPFNDDSITEGMHITFSQGFNGWTDDDSHSGTRFEIIREVGHTIAGTNKQIKILGADMYGYSGEWEGTPGSSIAKTYYNIEEIIEALFSLKVVNDSPFGILPWVLKSTTPVYKLSGSTNPIPKFHRVLELPDSPLEALRMLQLTGKFFLRIVPELASGLPRFGVELIPRSDVNPLESIVTGSNSAVVEWTEKPVENAITAVVVKPNQPYLKTPSRGDIVGWFTPDTDNLEGGSYDSLRALHTVPDGAGVVNLTVAAFPAHSGADYYQDGQVVYNDVNLKKIAEYYFDYWRGDLNGLGNGYRSVSGSCVDKTSTIQLGSYITFTGGNSPHNINEPVLITKRSVALDGVNPVVTFEGKIGPFTPATQVGPTAVITGSRVVHDQDDNGSEPVTFSAENSYSPEGLPLTYTWEWKTKGGGVYANFTTYNQALGAHTFSTGAYDIRLTVSDGTNSDTEEINLYVIASTYEPEVALHVFIYKFYVRNQKIHLGFNTTKGTRSYKIEYNENDGAWTDQVNNNGDEFNTPDDTDLDSINIKPGNKVGIRVTPYADYAQAGAIGVRKTMYFTHASNLKVLASSLTVDSSGTARLVVDTDTDVLSVSYRHRIDGGAWSGSTTINEGVAKEGVQIDVDPTGGTPVAEGEKIEVELTPWDNTGATGNSGNVQVLEFTRPVSTPTIPPGSIASDDLIAAQRRYTIALQTPGDKVFSATGTNTITWGAFNIVFLDGATSPIPVDTAESPLTLLTSNTTYIYVDSSDSYNVKQTTNPASMGSDDYLVAIAKDDTYRAFVVGVDAQGEINAARINAVDLNAIVTNTGALNVSDMLTIDSGGGLKFGTGDIGTNFTGFYMRNASGTYEFVGENANVEQVKLNTTGQITAGAGAVTIDANGITATSNVDITVGGVVLDSNGLTVDTDKVIIDSSGVVIKSTNAVTPAGVSTLEFGTDAIIYGVDSGALFTGLMVRSLGTGSAIVMEGQGGGVNGVVGISISSAVGGMYLSANSANVSINSGADIILTATNVDFGTTDIKDSNDATGSTGQVLSQDIGGVIWAAPLTISANTGSNQAQSTQTALTVTGTGGIATTISGSTLTIDGSAIGGGGYTDWELWTEGVLRKTVTDGEPVNFTGVGGIAVTYGTNTVQIDGSGITGSYNWKVKTDESVALTVNSGVEILFSDGAGMSVTRSGQTINIATTALLGLDVAGTTGTGEIVEGETFTITGINGISTAMSGNTLTIDGAGVSGGTMDSWFVQVNGGVGYEIAEAGVLDFVQGNNMSITKTGTDELTFAVTGVMVNFTLNPSSGTFNPTVSNSSIITLTAGSGMTVEGTSATDITFTNTGVLDVKIDSDTNSATSLTKTAGAVTVDIVGGTGITTSHAGGVITVSATTGAPTTLSRSIVHSGGGWYDLWVAGTANDYLGEEFGTDRVTRVSGWVLSTEQTSDKASYHEFRAAIKTDATGDQTILFADEENLGDESTGHLIQLAIVNNTETGSLDKVSLQVKSISNTTTKWSSEIVFTELTNY